MTSNDVAVWEFILVVLTSYALGVLIGYALVVVEYWRHR